jgi:predicted amidohydrolase
MNFKVALLQIAPLGNDPSQNLEKGLKRCREAKSMGAELAVFPELWNIGATHCPLTPAAREPGLLPRSTEGAISS